MQRAVFDLGRLSSLPERVRAFAPRLKGLSVVGGPLEADLVVAIVGTRETGPFGAEPGTRWLAAELARRGVVIASGGALGVDTAAHEGALSVGGTTWVILPTGYGKSFPPENTSLFARIVQSGGSLVHPFVDDDGAKRTNFFFRNQVLVALSDVVIAAQAPKTSGTHNTCAHARKQGRPVWVVPPNPWMDGPVDEPSRARGALELIRKGGRPLYSLRTLLVSLGLPVPPDPDERQGNLFGADEPSLAATVVESPPLKLRPPRTDPTEIAVLAALAEGPLHPDDLVQTLAVSAQAVSRALLTLSLDTVVVDGPDGRYRRCR